MSDEVPIVEPAVETSRVRLGTCGCGELLKVGVERSIVSGLLHTEPDPEDIEGHECCHGDVAEDSVGITGVF